MDEFLVASFIIVTYNSAKTIRETLRCLQAFTHTPHEVIVCANVSSDNTVDIISSEFSHVRNIKSTDNLGASAANNLVASQASGRVLAFINPDLYVSEGWFEPLLGCLEGDSNVVTTSPVIRHLAEPEAVEAVGNQVYLSGLTYLQKFVPTSNGETAVAITALSGACYVIRRSHFLQVMGYSKDLFVYYEDTDLSMRLSILGLKHLALPAVKVTHDYHPSFGGNKIYFLERNRYLTSLTLFPVWALVITLPVIILSELMIWVFCLLKGKVYVDAKVRAWADIFKQKTWIQARRSTLRGTQKISDIWLAGLSPFINLQYLQRGFLSRIAEVVLFIVAVPCLGLLRLVILLMRAKKV